MHALNHSAKFPKTMRSSSFYFFLILHFFQTSTVTLADPAFTAKELILLSCGADASSPSEDTSNRKWDTDDRSKYTPTNAAAVSSTSKASELDPSVFAVPYETARVFHSPFTYTFPITTGQKFLRLYFYPANYADYNTSQSFFSITANDFILLSSFTAFPKSQNTSLSSYAKEFIVYIDHSQTLRLTFSPNPNSFAYVNGIEIVSVPDKLYFKGNDVPIKYVDGNSVMYLENYYAWENLYRLNIGGARVDILGDSGPTGGMFRAWSSDDDYIFGADYGYSPHREDVQINYTLQTPSYTAPPIVYTTARVNENRTSTLEWSFPVDSGFYYLLRLHLCEFTLDVTDVNQRVFNISIDGQTAEIQLDVIRKAGGPKIPIYLDYIKMIPDDDGRRGKQGLRLSLIPSIEANAKYNSSLLNGLEIFKLSNSYKAGSLAVASPELTAGSTPLKKKRGVSSLIYVVIGSVLGVLAVVAAVSLFIFRRRWKVSTVTKSSWVPLSTGSRSTTRTSGSCVSLPSDLCRYFSIDEIKTATRNFDRNFVVGRGGFGNVYKGLIDNAATTVAIKRLNPFSNQGAREFLTEIEMLSKLRHLHLVSLIGYCDDDGEMILVYDYMAHGTLRDHLYNSENSPLSWKQRLQICMGAAKGLNYLHTGGEHAIIHRDVKSTNILLDDNWVAKISDFGLSKMGQTNDSFTHISTNVKGTFGYLDPKYLSTHHLTRKSDVYAFGVVLFEVLSGRPAVDVTLEEEQHSLASWARYCIREGQVNQLIDPNLMGQISTACSEVYVGVAGRCIHIQPLERPTMADVVMGLELALTLEVGEGEYAGINESDWSQVVVSMDDSNDSKGEFDQIRRKAVLEELEMVSRNRGP